MTLRSRLTVVAVGLFAVGLVVFAAVTFVLVRAFLVERVDEQLAAKANPGIEKFFEVSALDKKPVPTTGDLLYSRLVIALLDEKGRLVAAYPSDAELPDIPANLPGSTAAPDAPTTTVSVGSGSSHFRITANARIDGPGTTVVALPLTDVDATLRRLLLIETLAGVLVLLGVALLMRTSVARGLRPLEKIADTANDIAAGRLSERVDESGGAEVERLGNAFNEMLDRLEASFVEQQDSEERLRRFVADASHELRTPLTSIRGFAELTRRIGPEADEERRNALARIEADAVRMSRLVDDLLLLARLDQRRDLRREPVDLTSLARDVVETARELEPERHLELITRGAAIVEGDPDQLRQVLTNLVGNVRTHTPRGTSASIRVEVAGDVVVVDVHDEGPGIAPIDQPHVFDRFYRADTARTRTTGGSGLGLAIARTIVAAHQGEIDVVSGVGNGTTFSVVLPVLGTAGQVGRADRST